jgi:hypothetical protein
MDSRGPNAVLLVVGGGVILLIIVAVCIGLWMRGATERARRAAVESFGPFAQRFGASVAPGADAVLPWVVLAGPLGVPITLRAEFGTGGGPMNDEPGAWVRKTLLVLAWTLGFLVLAVLALALEGANLSQPGRSSSFTISGRVRRTTVILPLPPYLGAIALTDRRGTLSKLAQALTGSSRLIGDPAFDDAFWVRSPIEPARAVLTPVVRGALLAFRRDHGRFTVEGGQLVWSRRSYAMEGLDRVLGGIASLVAALTGSARS